VARLTRHGLRPGQPRFAATVYVDPGPGRNLRFFRAESNMGAAELLLVTPGAVDDDFHRLVFGSTVSRAVQPRSSSRETSAALDALEAVRVDRRWLEHRRGSAYKATVVPTISLTNRHRLFPLRQRKAPFPGLSFVGTAGFEPAASCSQSRRATRLRYAP
jgi:hypothetical protein